MSERDWDRLCRSSGSHWGWEVHDCLLSPPTAESRVCSSWQLCLGGLEAAPLPDQWCLESAAFAALGKSRLPSITWPSGSVHTSRSHSVYKVCPPAVAASDSCSAAGNLEHGWWCVSEQERVVQCLTLLLCCRARAKLQQNESSAHF